MIEMRRFLSLLLFLTGALAPARAAVVESAPALTGSLSGSIGAVFGPPLSVTAINAPTLSSLSPVLLPVLPAPSVRFTPTALQAKALAAAPLSAPILLNTSRGPPTAKDAGYSAHVANSVAAKTREWAVPVEHILEDHDALLVGENHGSLTSVDTLTREMPRLAAAGVTALGIEGLKRPQQEAVDAFVSGRTKTLPAAALAFSPKRRESFLALLESARDNGVRVVALGLPLDGWAKTAAALAAARTGRPESFYPADVDALFTKAGDGYEAGFNESVAEVFLTRRNKVMAEFLKDALKTGGKAVVLVGQAHVEGMDLVPGRLMNAPGDWGTLARELGTLALRAYSLTLTGGLFTDVHASTVDRHSRSASYRAAAQAAPRGAQTFESTGDSSGLYHAGGTVEPAYAH